MRKAKSLSEKQFAGREASRWGLTGLALSNNHPLRMFWFDGIRKTNLRQRLARLHWIG